MIPYLQRYRLGVPGEVTKLAIADAEWNPTVPKGGYRDNQDEAELGRRIEVKWLTEGAPPEGKVASVPPNDRTSGGEAKQTIEPLNPQRYSRLIQIVRNTANWVAYEPSAPTKTATLLDEDAPPSTESKHGNLVIQETLVRSILARNLGKIETMLKPHPDFGRMEEVSFDLGRFDIFGIDEQGCPTVIELQLGYLNDGHIGKLCRYYGWLQRKYGKVRGVLLFEDAAPDLIDAYKLALPWMELKKFKLSAEFSFDAK